MSLISFIVNAGKKIITNSDEASSGKPVVNLTPDQLAMVQQHVAGLGLNVQNLNVVMNGPGEITISGDTTSRADAEKLTLMAGNIMGIEKVNNAIRVAAPATENAGATAAADEAESDTHTVERGDTLSAIARKYYGDANKYPAIFEANKPMLKDADEIYPGQVLRIPKQQQQQ